MARRLKAGRFNAEESERIYRLSRLLSQAIDVLESRAEATVWLKTPKRYLKMRTQLEYADTEVGARTVERLLGRALGSTAAAGAHSGYPSSTAKAMLKR
jgi:putative toxin-antitoxin system antitoxin component (TIGR02293 family)